MSQNAQPQIKAAFVNANILCSLRPMCLPSYSLLLTLPGTSFLPMSLSTKPSLYGSPLAVTTAAATGFLLCGQPSARHLLFTVLATTESQDLSCGQKEEKQGEINSLEKQ